MDSKFWTVLIEVLPADDLPWLIVVFALLTIIFFQRKDNSKMMDVMMVNTSMVERLSTTVNLLVNLMGGKTNV